LKRGRRALGWGGELDSQQLEKTKIIKIKGKLKIERPVFQDTFPQGGKKRFGGGKNEHYNQKLASRAERL